MRRLLTALPLGLMLAPPLAGQATPYHRAPQAIREVLDAAAPPALLLAPTGERALLAEVERNPPVRELAQPMLRLAGQRLDPRTRGPHHAPALKALTLMQLPGGAQTVVTLPAGRRFGTPRWAPDGHRFALTAATPQATELWLGDGHTGRLRPVPGVRLNGAFLEPIHWLPGSRTLLVATVPAGQGPAPKAPESPVGPRIQENTGKAAPVPTFQDLLKNAFDETLFDYYGAVQLMKVDAATLAARPYGRPALLDRVAPAPDGRHVLVSVLHRPFSYLVEFDRFPSRVEVWDAAGHAAHVVADLPLAEDVPIEGVRKGPRQVAWLPAEPATLTWVEALDGGDPKTKADHRDRLVAQAAPFQAPPRELARVQHRLMGVSWTTSGDLAVLREVERERRWMRTWFLDPRQGGDLRLVWDMSLNEKYRNPGQFLQRLDARGQQVLVQEGRALFLAGAGATPGGDRPFLDRLDPDSLKTERLWRCGEGVYEAPTGLLPGGRFLTRRESPAEPPNVVLHAFAGEEPKALTRFQDPAPLLRRIRKQLVRYKRPDGVDLSFTAYFPPDYKDGERRPALLWAYPLEYTDAGTAGQVSGSTERFTQIGGISQLFMALQGYVVLDGATMPVVGDPKTVNDTYLEQVVASAKAAIDKASELGFIDPARMAVGGHSYGAFMTANLLAHSNLFKCGIARSGAYNRTLTPFGFQSERRTLWEAPETYLKVSPFMAANRFHAPILLIHGEADDNSGTFPIQSERLYMALKGNGQTVRYVTLPFEAHGYVGRESVEHTLWEMTAWLDRYLKASPQP